MNDEIIGKEIAEALNRGEDHPTGNRKPVTPDPRRLLELAEFAEFDAILHADNPARAPKLRAIARVLRACVETPATAVLCRSDGGIHTSVKWSGSPEHGDLIDRAALLRAAREEGNG